jgi:hypothetical protein
MKRLAWISLVFACAAGAPAATAQGSSTSLVVFGSLAGSQSVSTTNIPALTSGQLTISFHGDPATGCAAQGICGYSGTLAFRPGSRGEFTVVKYRAHGRTSYQVQLNLGAGQGTPFTAARVMRAAGGVCSDAQQINGGLPGTVTGGGVAIALIQPQGSLLATRCAGPLDADLTGLGPQIRLTLGQLLRGRRTVPLSGTWSFASGGFAGTIVSSLTMDLGRPSTERAIQPVKSHRDREVTETLTLVRASGNLSLSLAGDPTVCQFLDSCGIQGSLNGTFAPSGVTASLLVIGPATRPYQDFLAALGLSRRGNPRGLQVVGGVTWLGGGSLVERLQQGTTCASSGPGPGGSVIFGSGGRKLTATYAPIASLRTRCPGPELGQLQNLASGSVSRASLGQPRFALPLSGSGQLADDGYTISQQTSLTLTLKRGRVHRQTITVPSP